MKITKEKSVINFINRLGEVNNINEIISEMLLNIYANNEISSKEEIEEIANKYHANRKDVYLDFIARYLGFDVEDEDEQKEFSLYIADSFYELDEKEYKNNPYYKNIKISNKKNGDYQLLIDHYAPYEIFSFDDLSVNEEYFEVNKVGYFRNNFPFIALNYQGVTWMSITPNEINTMQKHIDQAKGNIVVFGLGLGYFPYMASLKEEVTSITIIEKEQKIIDIFKGYIFNQFPKKDKIKIIKADAFEVLNQKLDYDFAFIDLWHSIEDGLPLFLKCKKLEKLSTDCKFAYWLDNGFYAALRRAMTILLEEQLEGFKESDYQEYQNDWDKLINTLYKNTKNITIKSIEDIKKLIKDESLIKYSF